jgi:hypothetical protein
MISDTVIILTTITVLSVVQLTTIFYLLKNMVNELIAENYLRRPHD